jgi:bifunctional NMN adenylyltransferase/nudix hydrolase
MLRDRYPQLNILPMDDFQNDRQWAAQIDRLLDPKHDWTGISGPDGFWKVYADSGGVHPVMIHQQDSPLSESTRRREDIGSHLRIDNLDKRQAVIWTAHNLRDQVFPTVDIVCVKGTALTEDDDMEILVGRKPLESLWRFPGGFVDLKDRSLLDAARREFHEEVKNIEVASFEYVDSMRVNDWRFKDTQGIMTTVFRCAYVFGFPVAGDDLAEVKWVPKKNLTPDLLVPVHRPILERILRTL